MAPQPTLSLSKIECAREVQLTPSFKIMIGLGVTLAPQSTSTAFDARALMIDLQKRLMDWGLLWDCPSQARQNTNFNPT